MSDVDTEEKVEPREDEGELVAADDAIIGVAFRWSLVVIGVAAATFGLLFWLARSAEPEPIVIERAPIEAPDVLRQDDPDMPAVPFIDVTSGAGIDFVHHSGAAGEKLLPETMGSGAAFLDYDGDGDPDLLLVNARPWPHDAPDGPVPTQALYRNDGRGGFEDVTAGSGLDVSLYGTGVACGDYDDDGHVDVYVAALGRNRLFRGTGGGFTEVADAAGAAGPDTGWSTSTGFFDYDRDGDLDLFVCNYVEWSRAIDLELNFTLNGTDRAYGPPTQYEATSCALYRNDDGRFTDVTSDAGIAVVNPATGRPMGKALALTFVDVDNDGWLDVLVANDTVQNFVFRNQGDGTFEEVGSRSGVAFDTMGSATGAMGIDAGDFANDGRIGVGIANFANEATSFYVQQTPGSWQFADMASAEGIGSPSRLNLSFGLLLLDFDLDGRLDLLQANGHLEDEINEIQPSQHYRQPAQLFWNCGPDARSCFAAVPKEDLGDLARPIVGRGATCADIDGDGDLDVLLTQTNGPPRLLRNDQALGRHWLALTLQGNGTTANRDAIGAKIAVTAGGATQQRTVMPTRSYLSQVPLTTTFGLGDATEVDTIRITWPDGMVQELADAEIDAVTVIRQPAP
jgi:hypothetical protein